MQCNIEYTPADGAPQCDDSVLAEFDPAAALETFRRAYEQYERGPFELSWRSVMKAYADLRSHTVRSRRRDLWSMARSGEAELLWLLRFSAERDRRYARSLARKTSKQKYDVKNAKTSERREQIKAANARYRAKVKAEKMGVANDRL